MSGAEPGRSIWAVRDVRIAVPARAVSTAGDSMALVALMLRAHDTGMGTWAVGGLMACFALPQILLMGRAGRVIDAHDSRKVLLYANSLQVLACLGLAFTHQLWATYVLVLCLQTGQAFTGPTWSALVPRMVGRENVGKVISWQQGLNASLGPLGAALSGVLVHQFGDRPTFLIDTATFAVLLLAGQVLRTRRGGPDDEQLAGKPAPAGRPRATEGLALLRDADLAAWTLLWVVIPIGLVMESVNVNEVFLVVDHLGATKSMFGLTEIFTQAGAVIGAAVAGKVVADRLRAFGSVTGIAATAVAVLAMGLAPGYWSYAALAFAVGVAGTVGNALFSTLLVTRSPDEHRGRIASGVNGLIRANSLVAMALGAVLGQAFGPRPVFWVGGALGLVVALVGLLRLRSADRRGVLGATEPEVEPPAAAAAPATERVPEPVAAARAGTDEPGDNEPSLPMPLPESSPGSVPGPVPEPVLAVDDPTDALPTRRSLRQAREAQARAARRRP